MWTENCMHISARTVNRTWPHQCLASGKKHYATCFPINFINIRELNLHIIHKFICFCLFLNKALTFCFCCAVIYDNLPWFTVILNFINVIDSRFIFSLLKILKMGQQIKVEVVKSFWNECCSFMGYMVWSQVQCKRSHVWGLAQH